jgi:nucleoid-associated protein YgaU
VLLAVIPAALGAARPSSGAAPGTPYVVRPGDTLWTIAQARYGGDPRRAVFRMQAANGLDGPDLQPGQVLLLP